MVGGRKPRIQQTLNNRVFQCGKTNTHTIAENDLILAINGNERMDLDIERLLFWECEADCHTHAPFGCRYASSWSVSLPVVTNQRTNARRRRSAETTRSCSCSE